MQTIDTVAEMRRVSAEARARGKSIGFVPTMGYLHAGSTSLLELAREQFDFVVLSIYVNPAQFGPNEDPVKFPRNLERDLETCKRMGADVVFAPNDAEIYGEEYSTYLDEESLSGGLCGASRPRLFRGKVTVSVKFLNIIRPSVMFVGRVDHQFAVVMKRVLRNLHLPVRVAVGPTIRAEDGLAWSVYSDRFTSNQRKEACHIYRALCTAEEMIEEGMRSADRITGEIIYILGQYRRLRVIYVSVVHPETLSPLREIVPGGTLIAVAAWCDEYRLVDNILI